MLTVLRATARHLGLAQAPASPAARSQPSSAPYPRPFTQSAHQAPTFAMNSISTAPFARSPLNTGASLTAAQIDTVSALYRNPNVQRAAGEARLALVRAIEHAAYRGLINSAIEAAGDDLSPDRVAADLKRMAEDAEAALVEARADQAEHDRIAKARGDQLMPLRTAVSERLNKLQTELNSLANRAYALRQTPSGLANTAESRRLLLLQAGLDASQIAALNIGDVGPSREEQRKETQARIAAVKAAMEPLHQFCEAGDESVLAGLGFDDLIAARHAVEVRE